MMDCLLCNMLTVCVCKRRILHVCGCVLFFAGAAEMCLGHRTVLNIVTAIKDQGAVLLVMIKRPLLADIIILFFCFVAALTYHLNLTVMRTARWSTGASEVNKIRTLICLQK